MCGGCAGRLRGGLVMGLRGKCDGGIGLMPDLMRGGGDSVGGRRGNQQTTRINVSFSCSLWEVCDINAILPVEPCQHPSNVEYQ